MFPERLSIEFDALAELIHNERVLTTDHRAVKPVNKTSIVTARSGVLSKRQHLFPSELILIHDIKFAESCKNYFAVTGNVLGIAPLLA